MVAPEEMEGRMVDLEEMEGRIVAPEKTEKVLVVTVDPGGDRGSCLLERDASGGAEARKRETSSRGRRSGSGGAEAVTLGLLN